LENRHAVNPPVASDVILVLKMNIDKIVPRSVRFRYVFGPSVSFPVDFYEGVDFYFAVRIAFPVIVDYRLVPLVCIS
jgi:hypothetical protein